VFDPLGGYGDLIERRVRFIGDPSARIEEDYLRILRFFRFNAYYGKGPLDADGLAACVRLRADLEQLSAERVAGELKRILVAPQAVRAIETLFDYGLLTALLGGVPRLMRFARLVGAEEALGLAPDAALRLAALAVFVPEDAERLAVRLRLSNAEQALLLLGAADHDKVKLPDEIAARRSLYRLGPCKFEAHVLLASADEGAAPDDRLWRQALRLADRWQVPEFPVRGPDIMALGKVQGPEIGEMLRRLEAEWVASDFTLDRVALLARVKQLLQN
jgi:tRNA nucleotidyltransferase/poly(A) polymerase